ITVAMDDHGPLRLGTGDTAVRPLLQQTSAALPGARPHVRDVVVHDRRWRLTFYPTRSFLSPSEARLPLLVGLVGVLVSLMLASMAGLLVRQRSLALTRAQVSDDARRESEERFLALFNQPTIGVGQIE